MNESRWESKGNFYKKNSLEPYIFSKRLRRKEHLVLRKAGGGPAHTQM
jgi:hypothetical protein